MAATAKTRQPTATDAIIMADAELFCWYVLGVDPWWKMIEIMEAVRDNRHVAVKACNASSKTKTASVLALWWVSAWADLLATCITTSSSWGQVEKVIWKEIHASIFEAAKRGFRYPTPNQTDLNMPLGGFIHGMSTNEAVNFHGFHGNRVLFIKDESTGIDPATHEAIDSVASGGHVTQLDLGNPVTTSGAFNDLFSNPLVKAITIDAFESPNYVLLPAEAEELEHKYGRLPGGSSDDALGRFLTPQDICLIGDEDHSEGGFLDHFALEPLGGRPRDYLVSRRFAWEVYQKYGIDSPYWQSHVRGQFPDEGSDTLIPGSWVREATTLRLPPTVPIIGGLDVAGPGNDETVLTLRGGPTLLNQWSWQGLSSQRTIAEIVSTLKPYMGHLEYVGVDSAVIGYHLCGALIAAGIPVVPINVGMAATPGNQRRFANLKAQLYFGLRELFEATHIHVNRLKDGIDPGISLAAATPVLVAQLSSLRFEELESGAMQMEKKKSLRHRGVSSPDRAESLMLCYASVIQNRIERQFDMRLGYGVTPAAGPSKWAAAKREARWKGLEAEANRLYALPGYARNPR